jgi:CRISPR/Cas system-associated protein Cas7 (RAMP superfamily)
MSLNVLAEWQAHSLSNSGTNGSIRLLPRRQLLADGTETDACSGNIAKHHHAVLLAEYFEEAGVPLCPACAVRDGRRVAALVNQPGYKKMSMEQILSQCGLCGAHGFLVTAEHAASDGSAEARERLTKHSLLEFSFALALPAGHAESVQLFTRSGDAESSMLLKKSVRSGSYGLCLRYKSAGVGVDTDHWKIVVTDEVERRRRHRAILSALRDCVLCPDGALTATMLPHLTGLTGAIVLSTKVGRAPIYSPLKGDFVARLLALENEARRVLTFETLDEFDTVMNTLIEGSSPYLPALQR